MVKLVRVVFKCGLLLCLVQYSWAQPVQNETWENEVDGSQNQTNSFLRDFSEVADAVKYFLYKRKEIDNSKYFANRVGKSIGDMFGKAYGSRVVPRNDFDTEFDPNLDTKILIHGWMNSKDSKNHQMLKEEYLRAKDVNVLVIDWSKLSYGPNYLKAAGFVDDVGKEIALLIDKIIDLGAEPRKIHLIGHSLGAHVAGAAGRHIKSGPVARITGLDPALPNFDHYKDPDTRLDPSDALFVDVIHTCAGMLGIYAPIGHADFYPNGGTPAQPGCSGATELILCSHGRAIEFFHESIASQTGFWGQECENWDDYKEDKCESDFVVMGEKALNSTRGSYFLGTKDAKPFAMGKMRYSYEEPMIKSIYNRLVHGLTSVVSFVSG